MHCALSITQFPGFAQLTSWLLYINLRKDLSGYYNVTVMFILRVKDLFAACILLLSAIAKQGPT